MIIVAVDDEAPALKLLSDSVKKIKPDAESLYLFCGTKVDRMKAILWEEDGFLLLYKVLTGYKYQWPRTAAEVRRLTRTQYARLLEGLEIEKKVYSPPKEFF